MFFRGSRNAGRRKKAARNVAQEEVEEAEGPPSKERSLVIVADKVTVLNLGSVDPEAVLSSSCSVRKELEELVARANGADGKEGSSSSTSIGLSVSAKSIVSRFAQLLQDDKFPAIQVEAARVLSSIVSLGSSEDVKEVADSNSTVYLLHLLRSKNGDIFDQVAAAVAAFTRVSSTLRDQFIAAEGIATLLDIVKNSGEDEASSPASTTGKSAIIIALSNLLGGKPSLSNYLDSVSLFLPVLSRLLLISRDDDILSAVCLSFARICEERLYFPIAGKDAVSNFLEGKEIVLTGTFPEIDGNFRRYFEKHSHGLHLGKEKLKQRCEAFGAKVNLQKVSASTDILIVGREPGFSKVDSAKSSKGCKIMTAADLKWAIMNNRNLHKLTSFNVKIEKYSPGYLGNSRTEGGYSFSHVKSGTNKSSPINTPLEGVGKTSDSAFDSFQLVIDQEGVILKLVSIVNATCDAPLPAQESTLKAIGAILRAGSDAQIRFVVGAGGLAALSTMLLHTSDDLRREASSILTNFLANEQNIQVVLSCPLIVPGLVQVLGSAIELPIKKDIIWAFRTLFSAVGGSNLDVVRLAKKEALIPSIGDLMVDGDAELVNFARGSLENILKSGSSGSSSGSGSGADVDFDSLNQITRSYLLSLLRSLKFLTDKVNQKLQYASTLRSATSAMAILFESKPLPSNYTENISITIPTLSNLLIVNCQDDVVLSNLCSTFKTICLDGSKDSFQLVIDQEGVILKLVSIVNATCDAPLPAQESALKAIGAILRAGSDAQIRFVVGAGGLAALSTMLLHTSDDLRREACWTIGEVTAGTKDQIRSVIHCADILSRLAGIAERDAFDEARVEAVRAISNCYDDRIGNTDSKEEDDAQFFEAVKIVILNAAKDIIPAAIKMLRAASNIAKKKLEETAKLRGNHFFQRNAPKSESIDECITGNALGVLKGVLMVVRGSSQSGGLDTLCQKIRSLLYSGGSNSIYSLICHKNSRIKELASTIYQNLPSFQAGSIVEVTPYDMSSFRPISDDDGPAILVAASYDLRAGEADISNEESRIASKRKPGRVVSCSFSENLNTWTYIVRYDSVDYATKDHSKEHSEEGRQTEEVSVVESRIRLMALYKEGSSVDVNAGKNPLQMSVAGVKYRLDAKMRPALPIYTGSLASSTKKHFFGDQFGGTAHSLKKTEVSFDSVSLPSRFLEGEKIEAFYLDQCVWTKGKVTDVCAFVDRIGFDYDILLESGQEVRLPEASIRLPSCFHIGDDVEVALSSSTEATSLSGGKIMSSNYDSTTSIWTHDVSVSIDESPSIVASNCSTDGADIIAFNEDKIRHKSVFEVGDNIEWLSYENKKWIPHKVERVNYYDGKNRPMRPTFDIFLFDKPKTVSVNNLRRPPRFHEGDCVLARLLTASGERYDWIEGKITAVHSIAGRRDAVEYDFEASDKADNVARLLEASIRSPYAYSYTDKNLISSQGNNVLHNVLDFLDFVRYTSYKDAFLSAGLDETKLHRLCNDSGKMDIFLASEIGVTDRSHRKMISSTLISLNNKTCLHLCVEKWDGQFICIQCYKYLNHDDGRPPGSVNHCDDLMDVDRDIREREIMAGITPDYIPSDLTEEQKKDYVGKLSSARGIPIGWLVDFTIENDCWEMTTQEVCRKFVYPATAGRRCRYVELDHMKGIVGPAITFISHCRGGTWGDLVAAVCDGNADRIRRVWIDIFACRQWPSDRPDLDFDSTLRNCSSFLVVCSSLEEVRNLELTKVLARQSGVLPPKVRSKIAFLRVWCLVEIYTATQCKGIPIIMKGGSCKRNKEVKAYFEFEHNRSMLFNMSHLIDIMNSEATVPQDKEMIIGQIRDSETNGIEKLNSRVRGTISSARNSAIDNNAGIVQNAAIGDRTCMSLVLDNPLEYLESICAVGLSSFLNDYIIGNSAVVDALKTMKSKLDQALLKACNGGHIEAARIMIDNGAYVDAVDKDGRTSLMLASGLGHIDVIRFLIEQGGNIHAEDKNGMTALSLASNGNHLGAVKFLVDLGADVNATDRSGYTALGKACGLGHTETARILLENGAFVDACCKKNHKFTPLLCAAQGGHLETLKLLLDFGADKSFSCVFRRWAGDFIKYHKYKHCYSLNLPRRPVDDDEDNEEEESDGDGDDADDDDVDDDDDGDDDDGDNNNGDDDDDADDDDDDVDDGEADNNAANDDSGKDDDNGGIENEKINDDSENEDDDS